MTDYLYKNAEHVKKKINVLQIVDKFSIDGNSIHGVARLLSWWIPAINSDQFELNILCLTGSNEAGHYLEKFGAKIFYSDHNKFNPVTIRDIIQTARRTDANILHVHGYKASNYGRIAGQVLRKPVILHEHVVLPKIPLYQKIADKTLAKYTEKTIVNCEAVKEFCIDKRHINSAEIDTVFNGIPLDSFRSAKDNDVMQIAAELGVDTGSPIIGTIARLDEQKGITYLLKAIPLVKKSIPDVQVLIVGDGTLRKSLEDEARQLGVFDDVIFTGERRDVQKLYKLMDVKIISSIYEGTTLTVFEAMASGTAIVATTVDGVAEVLENNFTGILVQPCQPKQIADAVVSLLKDSKKRIYLSENAKEVVKEYDINTSIKKIENIYKSIMRRKGNRFSETSDVSLQSF